MESFRYISTIQSGRLVIENLGQFSGKKVEIVITPLDDNQHRQSDEPRHKVRGSLKAYANPSLIAQEESAWAVAIGEKHHDL